MAAPYVSESCYQLHEQLGAGGMGAVYRGTMITRAGERRVAIKRLLGNAQMSSAARQRLLAEATLAFGLTHANVCQTIDVGCNDDGVFLVLEYIHGLDLRKLCRHVGEAEQSLDIAVALYIAREVARALDYAHRKRDDRGRSLSLVHSDVTPQNILLSVEGEVKLADFGIAQALGLAGVRFVGGTPGYVAPEVATGCFDHRADIYSLGVTLASVICGTEPTPGRPSKPDSRVVSGRLRELIERMTASRPGDRFSAAAEVEEALALELSRRHPSFTPSVLARLVREHQPKQSPSASPAVATVLSLTAVPTAIVAKLPRPMLALVPAAAAPVSPPAGEVRHTVTAAAVAPVGGARHTVTAAPEIAPMPPAIARARRWKLTAGAALAVMIGVGAAVMSDDEPRAQRPLVSQVADSNGVATSTMAIAPVAPATTGSPAATAASPAAMTAPPAATPAPPAATPAPPAAVSTSPNRNTATTAAARKKRRSTKRSAARKAADRRASGKMPRDAKAPAAAEQPALLTVTAKPWGAVYVDGRRVTSETPLYRYRVKAGQRAVRVWFSSLGRYSRTRYVRLRPGQRANLGFKP